MMKQILAAVAALAAVPVVAAVPFSGPFVGVQGGWQQDREHLTTDDDGTTDHFAARRSGFEYGAQAGYDFKLGTRAVFGVEGSVTGRSGRQRIGDDLGDDYRLKDGRTFGATARAGFLVAPTSLIYVRGGYENARFTLDTPDDDTARDRGGYVAGLGYEQALTKAVSARVEYDYSNFGHNHLDTLADDLDVDSASARYRRNAVTAGLNLHF